MITPRLTRVYHVQGGEPFDLSLGGFYYRHDGVFSLWQLVLSDSEHEELLRFFESTCPESTVTHYVVRKEAKNDQSEPDES